VTARTQLTKGHTWGGGRDKKKRGVGGGSKVCPKTFEQPICGSTKENLILLIPGENGWTKGKEGWVGKKKKKKSGGGCRKKCRGTWKTEELLPEAHTGKARGGGRTEGEQRIKGKILLEKLEQKGVYGSPRGDER